MISNNWRYFLSADRDERCKELPPQGLLTESLHRKMKVLISIRHFPGQALTKIVFIRKIIVFVLLFPNISTTLQS